MQILAQRFDELGLDPVREIHRILPKLQREKRVDVLLDLMPYLYPRSKAIEVEPAMEPITARFQGMGDEQKRTELKIMVTTLARRLHCYLVPLDDAEQ